MREKGHRNAAENAVLARVQTSTNKMVGEDFRAKS